MDIELRNRLKAEVLGILYEDFFDGGSGMEKSALAEVMDAEPGDVNGVIDFLWERESVKVDFGQGTVELKLKGMLMVEHEELSDVDNINENIRIRDELIAAFYEISEENDFNPVDSKALAERIGIDPEQFEIQFQVIEMMEYGNTLASGDVLITTDGKTYYEENYE